MTTTNTTEETPNQKVQVMDPATIESTHAMLGEALAEAADEGRRNAGGGVWVMARTTEFVQPVANGAIRDQLAAAAQVSRTYALEPSTNTALQYLNAGGRDPRINLTAISYDSPITARNTPGLALYRIGENTDGTTHMLLMGHSDEMPGGHEVRIADGHCRAAYRELVCKFLGESELANAEWPK